MDCEKCEAAMTDDLLGEADEAADAAWKRHLSGCARCSATLERLRSRRRIAPSRTPTGAPVSLEDPVLDALGPALPSVGATNGVEAHSTAFGRRFAEVVSAAGSWAMRPETAMAALFLVMIGTSVLLLRGKSSRAPANAEITVTEEGSPAPSAASLAPPPPPGLLESASATNLARPSERYPAPGSPPGPRAQTPSDDPRGAAKSPLPALPARLSRGTPADAPPPPASGASAGGPGPQPGAASPSDVQAPYEVAWNAYQAGRFDAARRAFDAIAPSDPTAELWAARSVREERGCGAAVARFDRLAQRATGTPPGWDALFESARCRMALGDRAGARTRFESLLGVDSFRERAQAELDRIARVQQASQRP